jgi:hypothetical protein
MNIVIVIGPEREIEILVIEVCALSTYGGIGCIVNISQVFIVPYISPFIDAGAGTKSFSLGRREALGN